MKRLATPLPPICCALLAAVLSSCSRPAHQNHAAALAAKLDAVLNRLSNTGAVCSARVVDLETGHPLYATRSDEPMLPASSLKLFTSAAALDRFGPDHTFKTYLAIDNNNLWIIGTGDPGTGDPRIASSSGRTPLSIFDNWADALRQRGITHIPGNLYYDDGSLEPTWVHSSWSRSFLVDWYAAPISGLNFNDNCIDISITPTAPGQPVHYELMPPVKGIQIVNNCLTADTHAPRITRAADANVITLTGTASKPAKMESKPVTDPGEFFADALRTHLETRGITIEGRTVRATSPLAGTTPPPPDKIVAIHHTPIRDVLSRINKNSQNLFAEALCKLLGQQYDADQGRPVPGSWESGSRAIHAFLQKHAIDDSHIVVADGSGLSRDNRASAAALTDLLSVMHQHPSADAFRASLSIAGHDGSLARRMTDLQGHLLGKTGYIGGVCSIAGYIKTRTGCWLCFAIIYNGFPGDEKPFQLLQDEACTLLANWQP